MKKLNNIPRKVEINLTNSKINSNGGQYFISQIAKSSGLSSLLKSIKLKKRKRGCSDKEMLLSLIYSLSCGQGNLSDVDKLKNNETSLRLLGLREAPDSRRLGEYLKRFKESDIEKLNLIYRKLAEQIAPKVIEHLKETQGFIPVFVDGTAIEVDGKYFENSHKGYNYEEQLWLHGVFIGNLWVAGKLHPGATGVNYGWKEQLENEVKPLVADNKELVWVRADNAYYSGKFISYCHNNGYDYSVSLTNSKNKNPILRKAKKLNSKIWKDIGGDEDAVIVNYKPTTWEKEQSYIVIKKEYTNAQKEIFPAYTIILVSRTDLPIEELVRRHRGKQGQENAFKGPLIELDLHHPPCSSFLANQAVYACGLIAQLLLRAVQFDYLPKAARKHSIRTIIRYFVRTAAQLVHTSRKWKLNFPKDTHYIDWINYAALQIV